MANNDDKKGPVLDLIGGSKKKKSEAPKAAAPKSTAPKESAPKKAALDLLSPRKNTRKAAEAPKPAPAPAPTPAAQAAW